jgi:WS/DGAT/MGAT family acyltransferase
MQRLRGSDAYAIYSETPTSPFVTLKVAIYRPTHKSDVPTPDEIRHFIKRSIVAVGASRASLRIIRVPFDLHHPVWLQDPDFSPDDHIHDTELPSPGGKAELCEFLSDLMGKPLDPDRPLWEIWQVHGLEGGKIAIVFRVHHALADGKTVVKLMEKGHTVALDVDETAREVFGGEPVPGKPKLIGYALADLARSYTAELPVFYRYLKDARQKGALLRNPGKNTVAPFSAPASILNAEGGGRERIYRYESFSLTAFKTLSRAFDCTINTLVMGVCSEALRRYLQEVNELPGESLITAMPVGDQGGNDLKRLLNSDIHNNNLAVAILPLHQNIADFRERLDAIKASSQSAIDNLRRSDGRRFDNYLDFLPGTLIRLINSANLHRQRKGKNPYANLVISNVPGPRKTLRAVDDRLELEQLLSVGNLMDAGHLNITVWSYVDNLAFSFLIRKGALPQPERLVEHLKDVVEELCA